MMAAAVSWSAPRDLPVERRVRRHAAAASATEPNGGDGFDLIPGGAGRQEFNQFVCGGLFVPVIGFAYTFFRLNLFRNGALLLQVE
jgi:hypothetical protein